MVRVVFSALLSHWRAKPLQLAMLMMGLSLATALWSGVQAINTEARASYARAAALLGGSQLSELVSVDGAGIDQQSYVALRRAGVPVSPVVEGDLRFGTLTLRLIGIDPLSLPVEAAPAVMTGGNDIAAFLLPPGQFLVSQRTADLLKAEKTPPLRIAENAPYATAFADIGLAQRLLGKEGRIDRMILAPSSRMDQAKLDAIFPGLRLKQPDSQGDIARLTDSFHLNLTAFGLLSFIVGLFIVYATIRLAFEQRRGVFRTLRSLGLSARLLVAFLLAELLLLALVAGLIGVVLGYVIASVLLPDVSVTLRGLYGADVPGSLSFRPGWWGAAIGIAVCGTFLSAGQSLWQVLRMPLLASAQPRAWAMASRAGWRWQALSALALFGLTGLLLLFGQGLIVGFATLGSLLLGSALLLPVILRPLLALCERWVTGPVSQWFFADTRQQLPGLSLALMALLLALAANIGVGTMVSSFRLTFVGWLDQRLVAELYVTARNEEEAAVLRAWLPQHVDAVLPIWTADASVNGKAVAIHGVVDHATYRDHWPIISGEPSLWDRLAKGQGVLINEQMARREALSPGDGLDLPGPWQTRVLGIYSDYGNPREEIMIAQPELEKRFKEVSKLRYGLRLAPERVEGVRDEIITRFGLPTGNVVDQSSIKRRSLEIFEKTFTVTAALNVLTLGVAGLALFASLATLSGMRLTQLAPVWALGLTRRNLVWLELWRTLGLAALTMLLALPVGLGLAWVLLAVVNVEAFGWRLPIYLFPMDWLRLAALSLLAALVAVLVPLRWLSRRKPADLLRVFANER
ncbi:FtsX-like permease family protein [Rhizobium paknamense]|uniref:ABC transport system permease protein n=1 Tax=Rhizobium paknamense TaxID=1206817 RepID=A0ABU0IE18_9HYPH|nr:FtsX-like permease family protein [Rhizobium paknamense]MDQ0456493.1 putative ABC transport system permease protein [Rhizobium paknamense]